MKNRPDFNSLKESILGLVGIMEAMEVANSKQLDAEFRRFTNIVSNALPDVRKESIEANKGVNDTTTTNTANAETKQ